MALLKRKPALYLGLPVSALAFWALVGGCSYVPISSVCGTIYYEKADGSTGGGALSMGESCDGGDPSEETRIHNDVPAPWSGQSVDPKIFVGRVPLGLHSSERQEDKTPTILRQLLRGTESGSSQENQTTEAQSDESPRYQQYSITAESP